jgi:hypothetical protein
MAKAAIILTIKLFGFKVVIVNGSLPVAMHQQQLSREYSLIHATAKFFAFVLQIISNPH